MPAVREGHTALLTSHKASGKMTCMVADCASIQAQAEFNQPFSDEEDERGQHNEGPHSKSQRLRGASQQSLTGPHIPPCQIYRVDCISPVGLSPPKGNTLSLSFALNVTTYFPSPF